MGLISWLFPSEDDRVRKAEAALAGERWVDARHEALGIDREDARRIVAAAESELARLNLGEALAWAAAGDDHRVVIHLELAEEYHNGELAEEFRDTRRQIRELRAERTAAEQRQREEREARLLAVDPLGLTGGGLLRPQLPEGIAAEDALEMAARLDLILENYPDHLRDTVADLGADFAGAVLALDEGRADLALQALLALPDDAPLVIWETARAAHALGDPKAAARALARFERAAGGHYGIGRLHTGVFLAQLQAEAGDLPTALATLRHVRKSEDVGGFLFAQLLHANERLEEAEKVVRAELKKNGRFLPFYALLAEIRLAGGFRVEAMRALESAMSLTCGKPGQCGFMPPDPHIVRRLATLYLEDGLETERALELADQARSLVQKPGPEDAYLQSLVDRAVA